MISIILTSFNEPATIGKAIQSLINQEIGSYELLVLAPDTQTLNVAKTYTNKNIRVIRDPGKGKPSALNLAFKKARGSLCILTDGDVSVEPHTLHHLLEPFRNKKVGAVTGRVIATNERSSLFGFWAHATAESFHTLRTHQEHDRQNVMCSGYLYALRRSLVHPMPAQILADDAYLSLTVNAQGYETRYAPQARVHVAYPNTLPDWIRQKKRTGARFYQLQQFFTFSKQHALVSEVRAALSTLAALRSIRELSWFFLLGLFRTYIWARVYFDRRLWHRSFSAVWQRVESTK